MRERGTVSCTLVNQPFLCVRSIQQSLIVDLDAEEASELWRLILWAAAACTKLGKLVLYVFSEDKGTCDIEKHVWGEERAAALVAKLSMSPRREGEDLGWVDD